MDAMRKFGTYKFFLILFWCLLCLCGDFCLSEEILGCGGFVKSDVTINYSRVELKLYTKKGSLKYQTDCAPNNGYYLIPLYDKGDYILKVEPPAGWSFEPSSMSLHIDGRSDPCSLGQDINFSFKGFSVTGKVISKGLSEGPSGVTVSLKKLDNTVIRTVQTNPGGVYIINKVLTGQYIIEATHPTWNLEKSQTSVTVTDDNAKVTDVLVIRGYDVKGEVLSEGEPIRGVHFILFSKDGRLAAKDVTGCDPKPVQGFAIKNDLIYLCHVTSSDDGKFLFPAIPPGLYKLVPFYKGENIEFDVTPSEVDFTVIHGTVAFQEPFQVQGFSVSGRVVSSPGGKGVPDAKVFLDGIKQAVTQSNGVYHLENMKAGSYKLEVSADHIYFEAATVKITPNTSQLPELVASKFSLCGQLKILHQTSGVDFDTSRTLLQINHKEGKEDTVTADKEMQFCSLVKPGKYTLKPVISVAEAASGLKFLPSEKEVIIIDEPVLDVVFSQFSAEVSGSAFCLDVCGELKFTLENADGTILKNFGSFPNGAFKLTNLLPGKYSISILKHDWCWKEDKLSFVIIDQDITKLEFHQTGYQMPITSSHATGLKITKPSGSVSDISIPQGTSFHCLQESGLYKLSPVGCHQFGKESSLFDTRQPSHVVLTATKHQVSGSVLTDTNVSDITVNLKYINSDVPTETLSLKLPVKKDGDLYKYSFSLQLPTHTTVEFVPSASQLLFHPRVSKVVVLDDCMLNTVSFRGRMGLFINGQVKPPIEGVVIKISEVSSSEPPVTTQTDSSGKFNAGPFDHDSKFEITAEKEGYIFKKLDQLGQFEAFKFADVDVEVVNENGEPLSGVLLSLSGGVDYRKNSITPKDGHLLFSGLSPGQYFLRSMMKEYNFNPPSMIIDVGEGASVKVRVSGKREAFSCFGITNSVTGETEPGVVVEAVGVPGGPCSSYQEEASSETDGTFRIRGLKPQCEYIVRLKEGVEGNQHIERASPREQIIKVSSGDISGVRLIIFRHFSQMDISGNVVTSQEYLSSLKVHLSYENSPDQAIYTLPLGQSSFFHLPALPIDNRVYVLKLDTSLSPNVYYIEIPSITFRANVSYRHFTLHFHPRPKLPEQDVTQGSLLALPLTLVLAALVYNYSKVIQLLNQGFDVFQSVVNPVRAGGNDSVGVEPVAARRKVKLRRVQ